jgi:hypothetical protein
MFPDVEDQDFSHTEMTDIITGPTVLIPSGPGVLSNIVAPII